ncbi:MAG: PHP domain-containing protein [Candidatus Daviesbacteria bacterium]|nr:PHP domain-containing protein [Candidatus Daviesbacteria bacterium]
MIEAKADLHLHSHCSDGLSSISEIVTEAQKIGLNFLSITDHNVINGIPELVAEVDRINQQTGRSLIAVPGVEVTLKGNRKVSDIVVLKPGRPDKEFLNFLNYLCEMRRKLSLAEVITQAGSRNAFTIIVHPGFSPMLTSVGLSEIDELGKTLSPSLLKNVGVEIYNGSARVYSLWNNIREKAVRQVAQKYDLAMFSFSDAHLAQDIGVPCSILSVRSITPKGFAEAFEERKITTQKSPAISPVGWVKLNWNLVKARKRFKKVYPERT